jgi:hypothetical protein
MTKVGGARRMVSIAAGVSAVLGVGAIVMAAPPGTPEQPTVVVSFNPALGVISQDVVPRK